MRQRASTGRAAPDLRWRLGTTGFAFPDWSGAFYPARIGDARRLAYYATQFDMVELDTTFHAVPRPEVVRRWAEVTPAHFRFSAKAPRDVTHQPRLEASFASGALEPFLRTIGCLQQKLALVLLQFPPWFAADQRDGLARLIEWLPASPRFAVEFRHGSWWQEPDIAQLLAAHRVAWAATDEAPRHLAHCAPAADDDEAAPRPLRLTADFLYVRWLGRHRQFPDLARERLDPTPRLRWWLERLAAACPGEAGVTEVYGVFNNGYAGHSPATCRRMRALLGGGEPPAVVADQPSLF